MIDRSEPNVQHMPVPLEYLVVPFVVVGRRALLEPASSVAELMDGRSSFQSCFGLAVVVPSAVFSAAAKLAAIALRSSAQVDHSSFELVVTVPLDPAMGLLGSSEGSGSSACSKA